MAQSKWGVGAQSRAALARAAQARAPEKVAAPVVNDPTRERMRHDEFPVVQAPRMEGEVVTVTGRARKQASRVERMRANGWVTRLGARALEIYEEKLEAMGYGNTKSCLDVVEGRGGGGGPIPSPANIEARDWIAIHELAMSFSVEPEAVMFVRAVLQPYGRETLANVAERMLPGGERRRMEYAAEHCGAVAEALLMGLQR
jgi:hypothetical protein